MEPIYICAQNLLSLAAIHHHNNSACATFYHQESFKLHSSINSWKEAFFVVVVPSRVFEERLTFFTFVSL